MTTVEDRAPWKAPLSRLKPKGPKPAPVVRVKKRTQASLAVAMLLGAVVFGAVGVYAYSSATKGTSVLVATAPLSVGARVSSSDVRSEVVRLASGMPSVSSSYLPDIGQFYATSPISPGALLVQADLSKTPPTKSKVVDVALQLGPAQYPATLALGETIYCVFTGGTVQQGSTPVLTPPPVPPTAPVGFNKLATGQIIATATVWQVPLAAPASGGLFSSSAPAPSSNGDLDITVRVPPTFGPSLAAAAAAGEVAVVTLRGPGS